MMHYGIQTHTIYWGTYFKLRFHSIVPLSNRGLISCSTRGALTLGHLAVAVGRFTVGSCTYVITS